jgi:hypothetical protein
MTAHDFSGKAAQGDLRVIFGGGYSQVVLPRLEGVKKVRIRSSRTSGE